MRLFRLPDQTLIKNSTLFIILSLFYFIILFASPKIAQANHGYQFIGQWGSQGTASGEFDYPQGVAVDKNDDVYIADTQNHRIQVFDENGNFIREWGSQGYIDGQFDFPYGIAVDSDLNVYVADSGNNRIQKFTKTGVFIGKWGEWGTLDSGDFNFPRGVGVDNNGDIYVADSKNDRIQVFDKNGVFLRKWGFFGNGITDGAFDTPMDIAVDASNKIYVTDSFNNKVQKFDASGNFITKWGMTGDVDGYFNNPHGIEIDTDGNVLVVDNANDRVQKFSSNGVFISTWGILGSGFGQFERPAGIGIDSKKNVFIADQWNSRIQKFLLVDTHPLAVIDSVIPNPAGISQQVTFSGHGIGGVISGYSWRSSIDGQLSTLPSFGTTGLTPGRHDIYFKVRTDLGTWSNEVAMKLDITLPPAPRQIAPTLIWDSGPTNWNWGASKIITGDYNGDGLSDLAVAYGYETERIVKLFVFLGNATTGFDPPKEWWTSEPGTWDYSGTKLTSGDYNGDGLTDVGIFYGFRQERAVATYVFPSDGTKFTGSKIWWIVGPGNWDWDASKVTSGDFNGDSVDDIGVLYGYFDNRDVRIFVFRSDRNRFLDSSIWWHAGPGNWDWSGSKISAGDYNNDGLADFSVYYGYLTELNVRAFIFPSDSVKFLTSEIWWHAGPGNRDWLASSPLSGDLDADNIDDLIIFTGYPGISATIDIFTSNAVGNFIVYDSWWKSGLGNWNWKSSKIAYGDFNNDGLGDLVILYDYKDSRSALFIFR